MVKFSLYLNRHVFVIEARRGASNEFLQHMFFCGEMRKTDFLVKNWSIRTIAKKYSFYTDVLT